MEAISREQYMQKALPSSPDAERTVIGAGVLNNSLVYEAMEKLKNADAVYQPTHRYILKAMFALASRGSKIDPILIGEELKKDGQLESIGGVAAIAQTTLGVPFLDSLEPYVNLILEKGLLRDLIKLCQLIQDKCMAEEESAKEILDFAMQAILELSDQTDTKSDFTNLTELIEESVEEKRQYAKRESHSTLGLATGLRDFDTFTGGLMKTDLILVAGRPGMGKTTLALTMAQNAAVQENAVTAIFSLEMSKKQLTDRLICAQAKVDHHRYRTGFLVADEWARLAYALNEFDGTKFFIDDTPSMTALDIRSKARKLKQQQKRLDLIIIDYLDLIKQPKKTGKHTELKDICIELKQTAKMLDVPVVLIHQLNRECESRNPPRPKMSDLREAGEEDADMVLLLYREDYYKPTDENAGLAELIVAKARNSPTGVVKLAFLKEMSKFENYFM